MKFWKLSKIIILPKNALRYLEQSFFNLNLQIGGDAFGLQKEIMNFL